jgi:hypothetical protein
MIAPIRILIAHYYAVLREGLPAMIARRADDSGKADGA